MNPRLKGYTQLIRSGAFVFSSVIQLLCASHSVHAQTASKLRKPYAEEVVVETNAIVVALPQHASRWRTPFDGKPGFFSWRLDANSGPGIGIALAADSMMRVGNLPEIVAGSSLRRCEDAHNPSVRDCKTRLTDSVGVKDNFVQMILHDPATVSYFQQVRPATVRVTTFDAHGRFRVERFRVRYRDRLGR